jgi:acetate---CoA ligase (ADP-forming)
MTATVLRRGTAEGRGAGGQGDGRLRALLEPRAVAVVGASPDAAKLAGRPLRYFRRYGFEGALHAVNPKYADIDGVPCVASIDDLPDGIDLALLLVPASAVPAAVEACGRRGIPYAISIASGFAEAGDHALQAELARLCRAHGIRLVGPNCVGLLNPRLGVTATFSTELRRRMPRPGRLALVTQSGALGNALLQGINDFDIGLASWVSTGNEADLGVLDFVEHFLDDPDCDTIALFVEGLRDGERLLPLARRARVLGKAIVVLRAGRSELGRAASVSHTGKLAGSSRVWRDVARQSGLIEVGSLDEMLDLMLALDVLGPAGADAAEGLGVLTVSGGLGVLISDAAVDHGVPLPRFSEGTRAGLRGLLPPQMSVANPVDTALFTDERGYAACAEAVLEDPDIGMLLLVLTSLAHDYKALVPWIAGLAGRARPKGRRVAVTYLSSGDLLEREDRQALLSAGVLVLPSAERVVATLGRRLRAKPGKPADFDAAPGKEPRAERAAGSGSFLARAGIAEVPQSVCRTPDEAAAFAGRVGYPVALKVASPDIAHKTEVGGVALGLADEAALRSAWTAVAASLAAKAPEARLEGMQVQAMVQEGVELILGGSIDPELGRVLLVGAGGIWTEVLEDVRFLGLPASPAEIEEALWGLRVAPLLAGARGRPAMDVRAAVEAIGRLADAFLAEDGIAEIDINPLIVRPEGLGAVAVDALVVERGREGKEEEKR